MTWHPMLAQRRLEWWLAAYTIFWGLFLVALPDPLVGSPYTVMRIWAPAPVWGCATAAVGLFHIWALYINGRRHWSAYIRAAATACNAAVFTLALAAVVAAVWHGLAPISATVTIYVAPVWAAVCAFMVAASDAYVAACRTADRCLGH